MMFLIKKKRFYNKKITTFQKAKTVNFAKGLTHGFSEKVKNFLYFFKGKMSLEIVFHDALGKKKTILQ